MNKIVLEHYPASKLPEDMRQGLSADAVVKIVIEEERTASPFASGKSVAEPRNLADLLDERTRHPGKYSGNVTTDEAVARIRELRDEWDDE